MSDKKTKCCADCAYLNKLYVCERYNIALLNVASTYYSYCECYITSDKTDDVLEDRKGKHHSRK
ncbi:MAG: hypothetical protein NC099_03600 [Corallococcus sp.]|nr:hypothetical protein [Corallococcus sp.]